MKTIRLGSLLLMPLFIAGCASSTSTSPPRLIGRPDAEVFMLSADAGFQSELLELKGGRFRYWFSADVKSSKPIKYPIEGDYRYQDDQLLLSDGQEFTVRSMNEVQTLWRPFAINYWNKQRIIDVYGILLKTQTIDSATPSLKPFFTTEQWNESREAVRRLEHAQKQKGRQ